MRDEAETLKILKDEKTSKDRKDNIDFDVMWQDFCVKADTGPIDHVKVNKQITAKINTIRDIQLFCRNYSR